MKTIFEKSNGVSGIEIGDYKLEGVIPEDLLRKNQIGLPQLSELEVMRHYKELSDRNFCIEKGFYPLGSCTMKYNPKVNELLASLEGFTNLHPLQSDEDSQGALKLMYNLQEKLKYITGMDAITLQPAAGAHGELTGMMVIKKFFETKGETNRTKVIIPDSAHGTNPASAKMCGFDIVEVKSNERGQVDIEALRTLLDENVAAIMMTNPNTLGIFEEQVLEISELMHKNGSLLYYDGANFNAIMGWTNPALMGFDVVHLNLHKTFATPHGGGGPGAGPVGVVEKLKDFLPTPIIEKVGGKYTRNYNLPNSIGKVRSFYGNFGVLVRAYAYVLMMGSNLKLASADAVLNANYIKEKLKNYYGVEGALFEQVNVDVVHYDKDYELIENEEVDLKSVYKQKITFTASKSGILYINAFFNADDINDDGERECIVSSFKEGFSYDMAYLEAGEEYSFYVIRYASTTDFNDLKCNFLDYEVAKNLCEKINTANSSYKYNKDGYEVDINVDRDCNLFIITSISSS